MSGLPDFDHATPEEIRKWGEELAYQAAQFSQIKASLIVSCVKGQRLAKFVEYDNTEPLLSNLVRIFEVLLEAAESREPANV